MCLSNVYRASDNALLMELAARVEEQGGEVILRDLFGQVRRFPGTIGSIDLENNIIKVRTQEASAAEA
ncbi:MAG: CooT family nickel-binding protein [Lachnospiraceae bacterium]|nr:CooT family nickel-binding protein [Lachnospiraceae bacterium]